ncbi:MAG: glycosyltransferase [Chloroflexota bacterium]
MSGNGTRRRLVLVIPCYNEASRLPVDALAEWSVPGYEVRLLMVNDGSRDGTLRTFDALRERAPDRIEILDLRPNRCKAEAVRQGMLRAFAAQPEYIGFWDADLATPLAEVSRFLGILDSRPGIDMVFGSRVKLLGRLIERKAYRHYYGRTLATAISLLLKVAIYDSQCGAKLFRVQPALEKVFGRPFLSRWLFDVEIVARYRRILLADGRRVSDAVYEIPLREWRDIGHSKVRPRDAVLAYVDLARIYAHYLRRGRRR